MSTGELVLAIVGPAVLCAFVAFLVTFLILKAKAAKAAAVAGGAATAGDSS